MDLQGQDSAVQLRTLIKNFVSGVLFLKKYGVN